MSKTIAQQLNIKEFFFEIKDKEGRVVYFEDSNNFWVKREYDLNDNYIYHERSSGYWVKREYDYSNNNEIYYEDSDGKIIDNRPKETTDQ